MTAELGPAPPDAGEVKSCCASLYASDWARLLLSDSFHPGGLALTERLGAMLALGPGIRVLDVATGPGSSAIHLARHFGCAVTGVDLSAENVSAARAAAARAGVDDLVQFLEGDAERLPVTDGCFDALICECAFCTFPDKRAAAAEFARVLRPAGRVGLSDLTRDGALPAELEGLLAWVACIADAQPLASYTLYLEDAGFSIGHVESHDGALREMVGQIRTRLLGLEVMIKLGKVEAPAIDMEQAMRLARGAASAVQAGTLGYALLVGARP